MSSRGPGRGGAADGIRVAVRVRPGASRTAVGGSYGDALVVAVTARPVDGAANEAVCRALADAFGVARRSVTLVSGSSGRSKSVHLTGDPGSLAVRLEQLLAR
jgi:uncharacterized protein (TIGR00251 family)